MGTILTDSHECSHYLPMHCAQSFLSNAACSSSPTHCIAHSGPVATVPNRHLPCPTISVIRASSSYTNLIQDNNDMSIQMARSPSDQTLNQDHDLTVISNDSQHQFVPTILNKKRFFSSLTSPSSADSIFRCIRGIVTKRGPFEVGNIESTQEGDKETRKMAIGESSQNPKIELVSKISPKPILPYLEKIVPSLKFSPISVDYPPPLIPIVKNCDHFTITPYTDINCSFLDQLCALLNGQYSEIYDQVLVIDARYDYEYLGGHIHQAINFNQTESLFNYLIEKNLKRLESRLCIIMHCEFSSQRAPRLIKAFRSLDRARNSYPNLFYPQVYLLLGGYKMFYGQFPEKCHPQNYVSMTDANYLQQLKKENTKNTGKKVSRSNSDLASTLVLRPLSYNTISSSTSPCHREMVKCSASSRAERWRNEENQHNNEIEMEQGYDTEIEADNTSVAEPSSPVTFKSPLPSKSLPDLRLFTMNLF